MSASKLAALIVTACLVTITALTSATVSAQQQAATATREQKQFLADCAAAYRWQAGSDDPSYKKLKAAFDKLSSESPTVDDQTMSINRDTFENSIVSGAGTLAGMEKLLASCADWSSVPAPAGPVRKSAFPEAPNPDSVLRTLDCLALARWAMGPDAYFLEVARERYMRFARLTDEDAVNTEIKRRTDNIDKALNAGAGSLSDLAVASEACIHDYHVIITGMDDRKMSFEYEKAHPPQVASAAPEFNTSTATVSTPGTSSYSSTSSSQFSSYSDGEDHRIFSSGGVDLTNVQSSRECIEAMDHAELITRNDLNALTQAMEFDKRNCNSDDCHYTSNDKAVLACASVHRAKGDIPSQCLKERAILVDLAEKICPAS